MATRLRKEQEHEVVSWRCKQLVEAGFRLALAADLAHDPGYDLHMLIELAERGCPHEVAARILAPLEDGSAA